MRDAAVRRHARRNDWPPARPGGMGGAQPLAVTMNGGVALCIEVDPTRIERRIKTATSIATASIDEALGWAKDAGAGREPLDRTAR